MNATCRIGCIVAACFLSCATCVMAQFEDCSPAATLVFPGINPGPPFGGDGTSFTNSGMSASVGFSSPCGATNDDGWFRYVATRTGTTVIDTATPLGFSVLALGDTVIDVHTACSQAAHLACNGGLVQSGGLKARVSFQATAGVTYYVRISSPSIAAADFYLTIAEHPAVVNDEPYAPLTLLAGLNPGGGAGNGGFYAMAGATPTPSLDAICPISPAVPVPPPPSNDVWFTFTATTTETTVFDTCEGVMPLGGAATLTLFSLGGATTSYVACNQDACPGCGGGARLTASLNAGTTYLLRVASAPVAPPVPFRVRVTGSGVSNGPAFSPFEGRTIVAPPAASHADVNWTVLGDANQDGTPDLVVGIPGDATNGWGAGRVVVLSGSNGAQLSAFANAPAGARLGASVCCVGDVGNDGVPDFAVSAPFLAGATPAVAGEVFIVSATGQQIGTWATFAKAPFAYGGVWGSGLAAVGDWDLDGVMNLCVTDWGEAGTSVRTPLYVIGDRNGDGVDDVARFRIPSGSASAFLATQSGTVESIPYLFLGSPWPVTIPNTLVGFPTQVCAAGRIDSDAISDYLLGIPGDNTTGSLAGKVVVVSGATHAFVTQFLGANAGDRFGTAVAAVGDFNFDGVPDFAIGAPYDDTNGNDAGSVTVVSSSTGQVIQKFFGDLPGDRFGWSLHRADAPARPGRTRLFASANPVLAQRAPYGRFLGSDRTVVQGDSANDECGYSVAIVPDADGDGRSDLIVGIRKEEVGSLTDAGVARLVSGSTGATIRQWNGTASFEQFGQTVVLVGDIDHDGTRDVAFGAPHASPAGSGSNSGQVKVVSGATGQLLRTFNGLAAGGWFGFDIADAGDVDGDGTADIVSGAQFHDLPGLTDAGVVRVHSGATGAVIHQWNGTVAGGKLGISLAGVGDVDGDGRADVAVGASSDGTFGTAAGRVFVFSGATGAMIRDLHPAGANAEFGYSLAPAGDLDRDGRPDILVGARGYSQSLGKVYVISGATGAVVRVVQGSAVGDRFGFSLASGMDVNADDFPDFVVGAPFDDDVAVDAGAVHLVSGFDGRSLAKYRGSAAADNMGLFVALGGDVDGDGIPDAAGGSPFNDQNGSSSGRAQLFRGPLSPRFPGTADDFITLASVSNGPFRVGRERDVVSLVAGNLLTVWWGSPTSRFDFQPFFLAAESFVPGQRPAVPSCYPAAPCFSGLQFAPLPQNVLMGPVGGPFGFPLLFPGGNQANFLVPPGLGGLRVLLQPVVLSGLALNGSYAAANAIVLDLN